uniref:GRAM domain-containing protein n=1 Tax=Quercus lobata TaxID=97700 RepID=A0A7N2LEX3_QUELO
MAAPPSQRSGGGRTTSLRGDTYESDKLESTTSWDALEWTKIEVPSQFPSNSRPDSRYVSHVKFDFLLEAEQVIVEGYGVVLVNTDEAGTLIVTNFRLIFLSEGTRNIIALGTIPLTTIEKFSKMTHMRSFVQGVSMSNTCLTRVEEAVGRFSVSCEFKNVVDHFVWALTGVYGPNSDRDRSFFWEELSGLCSWWDVPWCVRGDFNVVRFPSERFGSANFTTAKVVKGVR